MESESEVATQGRKGTLGGWHHLQYDMVTAWNMSQTQRRNDDVSCACLRHTKANKNEGSMKTRFKLRSPSAAAGQRWFDVM
jgi:hypothetical protein